jgi:hypothetical protein
VILKSLKLWQKTLLGVVLILVVCIVAVGIWQGQNIQALYVSVTQDNDTIAANLDKQREDEIAAIQQLAPVTVSPLTTEQSQAILDGTMTVEEVKEALGINAATLPQTTQQTQTSASTSTQTQTQTSTISQVTQDDLVNSCVAELYGCKVDIMAGLAQIKNDILAQWKALPSSERTNSKKQELGISGLNRALNLESSVDSEVKGIISRYKQSIKDIGGDPTVLDELWTYYVNEKSAEKSYYIKKYLG